MDCDDSAFLQLTCYTITVIVHLNCHLPLGLPPPGIVLYKACLSNVIIVHSPNNMPHIVCVLAIHYCLGEMLGV